MKKPHKWKRSEAPKRDFVRDYRVARAQLSDRLADCELQHGHPGAAEHLSKQAAEMRQSEADRGLTAVLR
jgi:hypothetical protein